MQYLEYYYQASDVVKAVIILLFTCELLIIALFIVKFLSLLNIYLKVCKMKKNILNKNYDDKLLKAFLNSIKENLNSHPKKIEKKFENEINLFSLQLNYGLGIFASLGNLAPFIGLFGTVWGILKSFESIKGSNNTSLEYIAPHISESLFATALGLFVAIPSVLLYNFFTKFINKILANIEYSLNIFLIECEFRNEN